VAVVIAGGVAAYFIKKRQNEKENEDLEVELHSSTYS
jgi:hypothetical protein